MKSQGYEFDFDVLYKIAKSRKEERVLEGDLFLAKKLFENNYDAKMYFEEMSVKKEDRVSFIQEVVPAKSKTFWELISLLVDKREENRVINISECYTRYLMRTEEIDFAELVLAYEVPQNVVESIRDKYCKNTSFKIVISPTILGGFIIKKLDGTIIDGSLHERLEQLRSGIVKWN